MASVARMIAVLSIALVAGLPPAPLAFLAPSRPAALGPPTGHLQRESAASALARQPLPLQYALSRQLGASDRSYAFSHDFAGGARFANPAQHLLGRVDGQGLRIEQDENSGQLALV